MAISRANNNSIRLRIDVIIVAEEGYTQYTPEQLQGAGLKLLIFESNVTKNVFEKEALKPLQCGKMQCGKIKVFIIGTPLFRKNIGGYCKKNTNMTNILYETHTPGNIDEAMEMLGVSFPKEAKSTMKAPLKRRLSIIKEDDFKDSNFSSEEIAALLMAVDELNEIKIYPYTTEVIYDNLVSLTSSYLFDNSHVIELVNYYIQKTAEKNNKK